MDLGKARTHNHGKTTAMNRRNEKRTKKVLEKLTIYDDMAKIERERIDKAIEEFFKAIIE